MAEDLNLLNFYWERYWKVKFIHDRESKYQIEEWCALYLKNHSCILLTNNEQDKVVENNLLLSEVIQICKNWILHDCLKEIINDLEEKNIDFLKVMCFGEWWDLMLEEYVKYRWREELKHRDEKNNDTEKKEEESEDLLVNKSVIESIRKGIPQIRDVDHELTRITQQYYKKSIRKEILKELNDYVTLNDHELITLWQTFPDIYTINTEDSIVKNQKQLLKVLLDKTLKYIVDKNGFSEEDNQFLKQFNESSDALCLERAEIYNKLQKLCTFTRNLQKQTYRIDLRSFLWTGSNEEVELSIEKQNRLSQIRFSNVESVNLAVDYSKIDEELVRNEFLQTIESMYKYVLVGILEKY
ncbi:predicted protein [Naegleria gruberi]|uniref:Predicted protein n=1 Tax=Naegleria gruberi TaxID=5762 RepID=D2UYM2_NAEGR|nr:uncharacterized protein NAEGRDRAFT_45212 [Naegleria gruberi]EFC50819.1 predicted protein [Naegleria gruberi]|eukprot:XP_002683563.1 predicted protein [Naegleria gruberi strain NEG-M]